MKSNLIVLARIPYVVPTEEYEFLTRLAGELRHPEFAPAAKGDDNAFTYEQSLAEVRRLVAYERETERLARQAETTPPAPEPTP